MARRGRRRRERPGPSGFLVVDKPAGCTSHDVVEAARRWLGTRRVGHLGTLDPIATGVLPLAVREATKLAPYLAGGRKRYRGTLVLGVATNSHDSEGRVLRRAEGALPSEEAVRAALGEFQGEILQVPPMYSSVKHGGVPLYRLARRGEEVERAPRKVHVRAIRMTEWRPPEVGIAVECSPGTYVRTIAADLGERLGCGAHLAGLRRLASGPFTEEGARTMESLEAGAERGEIEAALVPAAEGLGLPRVRLRPEQVRRVSHGGDLPAAEVPVEASGGPRPEPGSRWAAVTPSGRLLAVMELRRDRRYHPLRVLHDSEGPRRSGPEPVAPQG